MDRNAAIAHGLTFMSIYHARSPQSRETAAQSQRPPGGLRSPAATADSLPPPGPVDPNVDRLRKATPIDSLLPASKTWLATLPKGVRPIVLAAEYARIVNLLAQQWNDYSACNAYFDDLLVGRRGKRRGFSPEVQAELRILRYYIQRMRLQTGSLSVV